MKIKLMMICVSFTSITYGSSHLRFKECHFPLAGAGVASKPIPIKKNGSGCKKINHRHVRISDPEQVPLVQVGTTPPPPPEAQGYLKKMCVALGHVCGSPQGGA